MKKYIIFLILSLLIFSGVTNVSGANIEDGKKIFDERCQSCHGGRPDVPSISTLSGLLVQIIVDKVRNGVQGTRMRPFSTDALNESDLNNVIAYLKNLPPTNVANKSPDFDINIGMLSILFMYIIYNKTAKAVNKKKSI